MKPRQPLKRTAFKAKRRKESSTDAGVRAFVKARDGGCVLRGRLDSPLWCSGDRTFGHLRKSGQGGKYTRDNGVCQCSVHQVEIEDRPLWAHDLGLVCRAGDSLAECWEKMRAAGLVSYGPDGEPA